MLPGAVSSLMVEEHVLHVVNSTMLFVRRVVVQQLYPLCPAKIVQSIVAIVSRLSVLHAVLVKRAITIVLVMAVATTTAAVVVTTAVVVAATMAVVAPTMAAVAETVAVAETAVAIIAIVIVARTAGMTAGSSKPVDNVKLII